jgi:hypothetical protein
LQRRDLPIVVRMITAIVAEYFFAPILKYPEAKFTLGRPSGCGGGRILFNQSGHRRNASTATEYDR